MLLADGADLYLVLHELAQGLHLRCRCWRLAGWSARSREANHRFAQLFVGHPIRPVGLRQIKDGKCLWFRR